MSINREIERKFLLDKEVSVDHLQYILTSAHQYKHIIQGYFVKSGDRHARVRVVNGIDATLTVKSSDCSLMRDEFEYDIPVSLANEIIDSSCYSKLSKERYITLYNGREWSIDVIPIDDNDPIIIIEVEIGAIDESINIPPWVGVEVTGDPRYYSINLSNSISGF